MGSMAVVSGLGMGLEHKQTQNEKSRSVHINFKNIKYIFI